MICLRIVFLVMSPIWLFRGSRIRKKRLLSHVLLFHRIHANERQQLSKVIEEADQQVHEPVLAEKQGKRQRQNIGGNRDDGANDIAKTESGSLRLNRAAQQSPAQHERALPAAPRD